MIKNNPIQTLMDEHEVISVTEELIQSLDKKWNSDSNSYTQKVEGLIYFFREYTDKFHHRKEEEVLFKKLKDNPDFLLDDIITELEEHHEMFRETVINIEEALSNEDFEKVQSLLSRYINNLLDHIAIENDELYSMAESLFNEGELENMYFLFEDIDRELGKERKQKLAKGLTVL